MQTLRVAAATARRALLADAVLWSGRGLAAGSGAAILAVAAAKLTALDAGWPLLVGLPVACGLMAGVAIAAVRRWDLLRAAEAADRSLGLKDKLSSAIELSRSPLEGTDAAFASWSIREAELAAARVEPAKVVPLRWEWWWGLWPVLIAAAVAAAVFAPELAWRERLRDGRSPQQFAEQRAAAAQVQQVAQSLEAEPEVRDIAAERELKALEALHQELISGSADPRQASAAAAGELESRC
jgi:hypothetical protein